MTTNLLLNNFETTPIFAQLPRFESVRFLGDFKAKIQCYELMREGETIKLFATTIIRKDESFIWKSFSDMLDFSVKTAQQKMQGLYGLDLVMLNFDGVDNFNPNNFAELIVNHSRKLEIGEPMMIQYGSLYFMLSKRVKEDWGKIDFHSAVDVFHKDPVQLDLLFARLIRETSEVMEPRIIAVVDLSSSPIFKFGDELQTERLGKMLRESPSQSGSEIYDIYMISKKKAVELRTQFGLN